MDYFPIFMDIRDRPCLVVGGGPIAARKVRLLHKSHGRVRVIAPELCDELAGLAANGDLEHVARPVQPDDIAGHVLVVAATDQEAVNRQVSEVAKSLNIPVNVVDCPELCGFITPSMIDRSPVQIAVSTGGAAPVLARMLRARLESAIPAAYGRLGKLVDRYRNEAKARFPDEQERRVFWEDMLSGRVAELLYAGKMEEAEQVLSQTLRGEADQEIGEVYLVGAGPGDPDLLTFRALRLMQSADVVVHDRLVSDAIMDMVRRDADRIYVGKERDHHSVPQSDINALLVRLAKEGKRVLRLKGGDPFIFGRGGEEIGTLMEQGVPFQVVPGITAAAGCAAYAGIPLTHRDYAQSCHFVTGHLRDGSIDLNWAMLAQPKQTVVFYMGLQGLPVICQQLMAHGMPASTPAALVAHATTPQQQRVIGTLTDLPDKVAASSVKPPTLLIVGEVVQLHERLDWFEPDQMTTEASAFSGEKLLA